MLNMSQSDLETVRGRGCLGLAFLPLPDRQEPLSLGRHCHPRAWAGAAVNPGHRAGDGNQEPPPSQAPGGHKGPPLLAKQKGTG